MLAKVLWEHCYEAQAHTFITPSSLSLCSSPACIATSHTEACCILREAPRAHQGLWWPRLSTQWGFVLSAYSTVMC